MIHFNQIQIRPIVQGDEAGLFELFQKNKKRFSRYFPKTTYAMRTIDSTHQYVDKKMKQQTNREVFAMAIEDKAAHGIIIGLIIIKSLDWRSLKAELAYCIGGEYGKKGIITKAVQHITDYCFSTLKLHKVYLEIGPENKGSRRVAEKNGFQLEGVLRDGFRIETGEWVDTLYFGKINTSEL